MDVTTLQMQMSFLYIVFILWKLASYTTRLSHIFDDASYLWQMVHTRITEETIFNIPRPSTSCGQASRGPPHGNAPPSPIPHPSISLKQLLATQNKLMRMLIENDAHRGVGCSQHPWQQDMDSSYSDFLWLTHHFSPSWWIHSRQKNGSAPPNPNSVYYIAQSSRRLCTLPNNSEAQHEPGGPHTSSHSRVIIMLCEASSALPSTGIISRWASCVAS
jgi:hypothetical protein